MDVIAIIGIGASIVIFIIEIAFFRLCENVSDIARDIKKIKQELHDNQIIILSDKTEYEKILNALKSGDNPSKKNIADNFGLREIYWS